MPSLQLISQRFGLASIAQSSAGVTRCNFSCILSHKFGKTNPLQDAEDMLHLAEDMLHLVSQRWKNKSIARCRRHVTPCSLGLQLAMVSKQSMQSLQKVELSSTLCNRCKPKKVETQVAKRACYTLQPTCNLSRNTILTQVAWKIAPCNTSCRARFYFLQRLQRFFETIASCSSTFWGDHFATCNGFLFPTLRDMLQRKLHRITPALHTCFALRHTKTLELNHFLTRNSQHLIKFLRMFLCMRVVKKPSKSILHYF